MWGMFSCVGNRTQHNLWLVDISRSTTVRAKQCAEHFCPELLSRSFVNSAMAYKYTRAARRRGVLGVVCCGTGPSLRVRARTLTIQRFLRGGYKHGKYAFQGGQRHHGPFWGISKIKTWAGGRGEATAREPALATLLWGMLYDDEAGVALQSSKQLREFMSVIVVVCAAFGLTVSEVKTEIMCLRMRGMPESTAIFSVEAAS